MSKGVKGGNSAATFGVAGSLKALGAAAEGSISFIGVGLGVFISTLVAALYTGVVLLLAFGFGAFLLLSAVGILVSRIAGAGRQMRHKELLINEAIDYYEAGQYDDAKRAFAEAKQCGPFSSGQKALYKAVNHCIMAETMRASL